jgi:hypothetical protein
VGLRNAGNREGPPEPNRFEMGKLNTTENPTAPPTAARVFDPLPTSNLFEAGNRIRVSVTCADAGKAEVFRFSPVPEVTLCRNADHPLHLVLPVVRSPQ